MSTYYIPKKYMKDWESICERYCNVHNYELLFVDNTSLGFQTDKGDLVHLYVDELKEVVDMERDILSGNCKI